MKNEKAKASVISSISVRGGLPMFTVNGEAVLPCGYMSYQAEKADYVAFKAAGYRLFFVPIIAGDRGINPESGIRPFYPGFWKKDGFDFSSAEHIFKTVVGDSEPGEIWIIPRVMVEPPSFWEEEHPDDLCRDASGASIHQCYSSSVWLRDTGEAMRQFQTWSEESGYDRYVAGWQIACGHTDEFMRPMIHPLQLTDYSEKGKRGWQTFLAKRYGTVSALNRAWNTAFSSLDEISVPSPAVRTYVADGENTVSAPVSDYNRFRSEETAVALTALAHMAKELIGERIVGAFYGYAGTRFGHDAADIVLESPDVDFLASPFSYDTGRAPGTEWALNGMLGSCRLHGKAWYIECDVRTHLSRPVSASMPHAAPAGNTLYDNPLWTGPDEALSVHQMKKAVAKTIASGSTLWWFDMWGGWYHTGAYMECVKKSLTLYERQSGQKPVSQVAVVFDTYAGGHHRHNIGPREFLREIAYSGVAFEQFALTDLGRLNPDDFRALVLVNVYGETPETEVWKSKNRSILHIGGAYENAEDRVLASSVEGGTVNVHPNWQEYFFEAIPASSALREAFLVAGAHIYTYNGDIVYAFGSMVAIHAASDGEKRIFLPHKGALRDVFTGECPEPCDHFTDFSMRKGETRVFEIIG